MIHLLALKSAVNYFRKKLHLLDRVLNGTPKEAGFNLSYSLPVLLQHFAMSQFFYSETALFKFVAFDMFYNSNNANAFSVRK